jgi:hypothetical protein
LANFHLLLLYHLLLPLGFLLLTHRFPLHPFLFGLLLALHFDSLLA